MSKLTLQEQWDRFVKSGYDYNRFTKDLYTTLYTRGEFIAHFDRIGFHKARFHTTSAIDLTIDIMKQTRELKTLINNTDTKNLIQARYRIAKLEYSSYTQAAKILKEKALEIKSQYTDF